MNKGLRRFYSPPAPESSAITVRGVGIRELMPPSRIERPRGREDWLIMLFHDQACAGTRPEWGRKNPSNTMMVWPPRRAQFYGHPQKSYAHSWIHCFGSRVRSMLRRAGFPLFVPFPIASVATAARFAACLEEIHRELVSHIRPDAVTIGNLLENCLRDIARNLSPRTEQPFVPEGLLAVRRLISEAPSRPVSLAEMAALAGMSPSNLSLRFKAVYGVSPGECLIRHRMQHAAHLLADRSLSIAEIGRRTGYDDPFHFSKIFKKHFGASPRALRPRE